MKLFSLFSFSKLLFSEAVTQRCSVKKGVLRNFPKFTGKHLGQRLFFDKVARIRPAALLKKGLWHRCFPVNFAKFLRTPFLTEYLRWLLLSFFTMLKKLDITLSLPAIHCAGCNTDLPSISNISKTVRVNTAFTSTLLKESFISLPMISRLTDVKLVVL